MKVLITGGNGNIGRMISGNLASRGIDVVTLARSASNPPYHHYSCDVSDQGGLKEIFEKERPDAVIHLASLSNSGSRKNPDLAVRVNVIGSLNVMDLCMEFHSRFLFGSSFNAIGNPGGYEGRKPYPETGDTRTVEFYGTSKNYIEKLGIALHKTKGLDFISARIPTVCGIGQKSPHSPWREDIYTKTVQPGEIELGFMKDVMVPLCDVREVAESFACLIQCSAPSSRIYNLPNRSVSMEELADYVTSLQPKIRIQYRNERVTGAPDIVSDALFRKEFPDYQYHDLFDYIKEYQNEHQVH